MPITINGSGTVTGISVGGLPDGIVDEDMLANGAVTAAKSTGLSGLTVVDQWRVNANFSSSSTDPITSNWERVDHASQGSIGTAMSVSSGVWTFPVTGLYQVTFHTCWKKEGNTEVAYADTQILGTTNNSSYDAIAVATHGQGHGGTGSNYVHSCAMSLVDVTDTSNVKVKFKVTAQASVTWIGHTENNSIYATFVRLGDT